jgi:cytochrome c
LKFKKSYMKKLLIILSFSCIIISCGDNKDAKQEQQAQETTTETQTPAVDPDIEKGGDLVAKSDCLTCHRVSEKLVGPPYQAVAERYQASAEVIDTLSDKIIKGGGGRWGPVPMTPHPQISKEDAKTMVKYVLSLKNQ